MLSKLALLAGAVSALPHFPRQLPGSGEGPPYDNNTLPYIAPGPTDSRAPCPALNALANHNYIPHDGRLIERQTLIDAFNEHMGIAESVIDLALTNAFVVCKYVTGSDCGNVLTNLTLLAEPHAFEHDHSFSRQDYKMGPLDSFDEFVDNQNFNETIFQTSLDVVGDNTHVDFSLMNQIRLQRESDSNSDDFPGWFTEQKPIQETEAGFIFALVSDYSLEDAESNPMIRVDWWKYWFTNESFPYHLGWHPPSPAREIEFVTSCSSAILAATVSSTPSNAPSGAVGPAPAADPLSFASTMTPYLLPTWRPYVAQPYIGPNDKREAAPAPTAAPLDPLQSLSILNTASDSKINSAGSALPPQSVFKNPYAEVLEVQDIMNQQAYASSRASMIQSMVAENLKRKL